MRRATLPTVFDNPDPYCTDRANLSFPAKTVKRRGGGAEDENAVSDVSGGQSMVPVDKTVR